MINVFLPTHATAFQAFNRLAILFDDFCSCVDFLALTCAVVFGVLYVPLDLLGAHQRPPFNVKAGIFRITLFIFRRLWWYNVILVVFPASWVFNAVSLDVGKAGEPPWGVVVCELVAERCKLVFGRYWRLWVFAGWISSVCVGEVSKYYSNVLG